MRSWGLCGTTDDSRRSGAPSCSYAAVEMFSKTVLIRAHRLVHCPSPARLVHPDGIGYDGDGTSAGVLPDRRSRAEVARSPPSAQSFSRAHHLASRSRASLTPNLRSLQRGDVLRAAWDALASSIERLFRTRLQPSDETSLTADVGDGRSLFAELLVDGRPSPAPRRSCIFQSHHLRTPRTRVKR